MRIDIKEIKGELLLRISELSENNVFSCYQCGRCSAGCPSAGSMDLLPNQVMNLLQLGKVDKVLSSKTIWVCAACFTCSVRCPKGIDIARVMEAARVLVLRENIDYTKIPPPEVETLPAIALVSNFRKLTA